MTRMLKLLRWRRRRQRLPGSGAASPPPAAWASDYGGWAARSAPGIGGSDCGPSPDWLWLLHVHYYRHGDASDGGGEGEGVDAGVDADTDGGGDRERPCATVGGLDKAAVWVVRSPLLFLQDSPTGCCQRPPHYYCPGTDPVQSAMSSS